MVVNALDRASAIGSERGKDMETIPGQWLGGRGRNDPRRFFVVLDCRGFGLSMVPSLSVVKKLFGFIADHYPRRLGKLIVINISRPGKCNDGAFPSADPKLTTTTPHPLSEHFLEHGETLCAQGRRQEDSTR